MNKVPSPMNNVRQQFTFSPNADADGQSAAQTRLPKQSELVWHPPLPTKTKNTEDVYTSMKTIAYKKKTIYT